MDKKILNEIHRQRKIMGLNSILLSEDTGISSFGEFLSNAVKSIAKQSDFLGASEKQLMKIGKLSLEDSDFQKLLIDLKDGNYSQISDDILDEISSLLKQTVDEDGVSFLQKSVDKFTTEMQKTDPNFNFDEWAKRTQKRVSDGTETLDDAITKITGYDPLLKRIFRDDLTNRYNKMVDEANRLADEAYQKSIDDAAEAARLESQKNTGSILDRIRARNPNSQLATWDTKTGIRFIYSWRWSPLTKATQWFDLGKAIETIASQFKDRNKLMNELLDEYEVYASTILSEQMDNIDINSISDAFGTKLSSMRIRFDSLVNYDESVDRLIKELVNLYKRNPELSKLTDEEQVQFAEEFEALLKQWNPNDPEFPTFVENIKNFFGTAYTEQTEKFKKAVLNADGIIQSTPNKFSPKGFIKFISEKIDSHLFTGTFKDKFEWYTFMKQRPYIIPALGKLPKSTAQKWSKYLYWWFYVKIQVPAIIGVFNILVTIFKPLLDNEMADYITDNREGKTWFEKVWNAIVLPFWDIVEEGFVVDKKGANNEKMPEMDPTTWDDVQDEFSILKSLLPINLSVDFIWGQLEKIIGYEYQTEANKRLRQSAEDLRQVVDTTSVELQRGLDSLNIPNPTEVELPEPEIDSSLLRQQEGPVETGPNDGRVTLINDYNTNNPNDKVTNYNPQTGNATYKGKNGRISLAGNGDLIFLSSDYQLNKNFGKINER